MRSFFAGACTWQKILLSLQVWNLFAFSEQIMHAADCKPFDKKAMAFCQTQHPRDVVSRGCEACPKGRRYVSRPYFSLMRSSFSSMGSAAIHRKNTVAAAWTQSTGKPVT